MRILTIILVLISVVVQASADDNRRGFSIPSSALPSDIAALDGYGINHIRIHLINQNNDTDSLSEYLAWLATEIQYVDSTLLPAIEALSPNIKVVISLTSQPGAFYTETPLPQMAVFQYATYQTAVIDAWEDIANQFADNDNVSGYIMVSEPAVGSAPGPGAMGWNAFAAAIAAKIRTVDTTRTIYMTPPYSSPQKLNKMSRLLAYAPVAYTINMYDPYLYTHQGLYGNPAGVQWGSKKKYKKPALRKALSKASIWARRRGVRLYIGEFSVVRWAGGGASYLNDLISLFESKDWDWAFHSWREASVWSVEHSNDSSISTRIGTSDRADMLKSYFSRND